MLTEKILAIDEAILVVVQAVGTVLDQDDLGLIRGDGGKEDPAGLGETEK